MRRVSPAELSLRPFHLLDQRWALLASGSATPNLMTVSWGGFGTLWNRPVATVYVRPTRHTFGLLAAEPAFTLNFLPDRLRPALDLCGEVSGRTADKWQVSGLTREPSRTIAVPHVGEAELALECRVVATLDLDPKCFLDATIDDLYPRRDYHRAFLGEVLAAWQAEG